MPQDVSAEHALSGVVEPGERVLWAGRPDAATMSTRERNRVRLRYATTAVLLPLAAWMGAGYVPDGLTGPLSFDFLLQPRVLLPVVVVLLLIPGLSVLGLRRFDRYARSLAYGLTDRRLLVLEGPEIVDDYPPERVSSIRVRRRGRGLADVIFGRRPTVQSRTRRSRDRVQREREIVAFKALADAESVQARIEAWLSEHVDAAEREVAAFPEPPHKPEHNRAPGVTAVAPDGASRTITQSALGLRVELPASWRIRVRAKKKPYGRTFFDREQWRGPDEPGDWNVVRADGPVRCAVEVEVFATDPTVSFESLSKSRIGDAAIGSVTAAEPAIEINGLSGFSVTRRNDLQIGEGGTATVAALVVLERTTVLHDGRTQVCARSTWPEDSEDLARTVDAVVHSIRLI